MGDLEEFRSVLPESATKAEEAMSRGDPGPLLAFLSLASIALDDDRQNMGADGSRARRVRTITPKVVRFRPS